MSGKKEKLPPSIKAFSLIELSIVILIIGILIAGVTQGSRLVDYSRLSSAMTMTKSSPVSTIPDLFTWYDAVSEESFVDNIGNGDAIATWNDIGTQSLTKHNATQNTSASQPTYAKKGINSLPSVSFDGSNDYLSAASFIPGTTSSTTFIVFQDASTAKPIIGTDDWGISFSYGSSSFGASSNYLPSGGGIGHDTMTYTIITPSGSTARIITLKSLASSTSATTISMYLNGQILTTLSPSGYTALSKLSPATDSCGYTIAKDSTSYYQGYIAEIIVYNRALKNEERYSIESYLAKKWGATVVQS